MSEPKAAAPARPTARAPSAAPHPSPVKKRRTTAPRPQEAESTPRLPDECWCINRPSEITVRRVTINGQEVVHICDSYGPGITVSDDQLLDDETCHDLRERILNASGDPEVVRYAGRRSFVPADMGDTVARLVRSPGWGRVVERALVAPLYNLHPSRFELVSACGFVVERGTKKQQGHTDINLEKDLDRADRGVVAIHIPLDETSELLGGTQWLGERGKEPLATVWGRRGRPYALNAALWHGGSGNRTTERRAVLALRFLPTDLWTTGQLSMRARRSAFLPKLCRASGPYFPMLRHLGKLSMRARSPPNKYIKLSRRSSTAKRLVQSMIYWRSSSSTTRR